MIQQSVKQSVILCSIGRDSGIDSQFLYMSVEIHLSHVSKRQSLRDLSALFVFAALCFCSMLGMPQKELARHAQSELYCSGLSVRKLCHNRNWRRHCISVCGECLALTVSICLCVVWPSTFYSQIFKAHCAGHWMLKSAFGLLGSKLMPLGDYPLFLFIYSSRFSLSEDAVVCLSLAYLPFLWPPGRSSHWQSPVPKMLPMYIAFMERARVGNIYLSSVSIAISVASIFWSC